MSMPALHDALALLERSVSTLERTVEEREKWPRPTAAKDEALRREVLAVIDELDQMLGERG